ncbi:unnamed protein product [Discula destructiva]
MPTNVTVAPLGTLRISTHLISAHHRLPNSSVLQKPLLIYHSVFSSGSSSSSSNSGSSSSISASAVETHLIAVGVVEPQWRYSMYRTTHFHSSSHEVLCVTAGRAKLCFGGEDNPARVEPTVQAGDVMVLPAGMAHRLLDDLSGAGGCFEMVGSYPRGCHWDMCYGKAEEDERVTRIGELPWFERDPIFGDRGPVLDV